MKSLYSYTLDSLQNWSEVILHEHGFFHALLEKTANILNSTVLRSRSFIRINSMVNREIEVTYFGKADEG